MLEVLTGTSSPWGSALYPGRSFWESLMPRPTTGPESEAGDERPRPDVFLKLLH